MREGEKKYVGTRERKSEKEQGARWEIAFLSAKHYVCKLTMVNVSRVNTFAK